VLNLSASKNKELVDILNFENNKFELDNDIDVLRVC